MSLKPIDPKETYIVREVFCCGHGHCPGVLFTHWEAGEGCVYIHKGEPSSIADEHFYWRLALVPLYRGDHTGTTHDPYSPLNGEFWEFANLPENVNKWCHFSMAPKGLKEGQRIEPKVAA